MGRNPSSFAKRQRERERQRKRAEKAARRRERRERGDDDSGDADNGIDPDIAGIVPGPQPHPFLEEEEPGERQKEAPTVDEIVDG